MDAFLAATVGVALKAEVWANTLVVLTYLFMYVPLYLAYSLARFRVEMVPHGLRLRAGVQGLLCLQFYTLNRSGWNLRCSLLGDLLCLPAGKRHYVKDSNAELKAQSAVAVALQPSATEFEALRSCKTRGPL